MGSRIGPLAVAVLLVLAGCSGMPSGGSQTTQSSEKTTVQTPSISTETAKEQALEAEETRIKRILENASNITGSVGVYGEKKATVLNRSSEGIRIRVVMSYSYEYHCNGKDGNVDSLTTQAVYFVTNDSTKLVEVEKEVNLIC
ncbi:DUF7537 family lipoprotein [Haloparvum sp. AD34]